MPPGETKYLTPGEVAAQLRVTPEAVQTWCRAGRLRAVRAGRRWLITAMDVGIFIGEEEQKNRSGAVGQNGAV